MLILNTLLLNRNAYGRGNCAYCHEQHAGTGGEEIDASGCALFYSHCNQCNLFCCRCHGGFAGAEQDVDNYPDSVDLSKTCSTPLGKVAVHATVTGVKWPGTGECNRKPAF